MGLENATVFRRLRCETRQIVTPHSVPHSPARIKDTSSTFALKKEMPPIQAEDPHRTKEDRTWRE